MSKSGRALTARSVLGLAPESHIPQTPGGVTHSHLPSRAIVGIMLSAAALAACGGGGGGSGSAATQESGPVIEAGPENGGSAESPRPPDEMASGANALSYRIVDTGQTTFYDERSALSGLPAGTAWAGQDAGHAGHQPSCTNQGDGTVLDNVTGLTWQRSPDRNGDGRIDASDKLSYADAEAGASQFDLGGHDDWRLPTIKELYSLIRFTGIDPDPAAASSNGLIPFIDTACFDFAYGDPSAGERIIDSQWASSTLYVSTVMFGQRAMFGVNFADGRIKGYPADPMPGLGTAKTYYVLYVRGNPAYGLNDFVDNGDGTITDRATGLMWMQNDSGTAMNWANALAWVEQLNAQSHLGYADWRLPDAKELQSIVDYTRAPGTSGSAAINPVFRTSVIVDEARKTNYPFYWSSTTHVNGQGGGDAVYVAFGEALGYFPDSGGTYSFLDVHGAGAQRSDPKTGTPSYGHGPQGDVRRIYNHVRAVRTIGQ